MTTQDPRVDLLLQAISALAAGRFDARVPHQGPGAPDDIDRIVEGFLTLRDVLAARESSMRQTEQLSVLLQEVNTQLSESRTQLARLAEQDPLTDLANRRAFLAHLEHRLSDARSGGAPFAVLYLDLDSFKPVNDQFGHRAGDAVLKSVARALKSSLRGVDVAARLRGDEFAALIQTVRAAVLEGMGARILARVEHPVVHDGLEVRVSASLGIVVSDGSDDSADALLERADRAMYLAKEAGGGLAQVILAQNRSA